MHRIDGAGATPDNRFTDGDPASATPATVVTDSWLNSVQEEIINVILDPSISPPIVLNKAANNQLVLAIKRLASQTTDSWAVMPIGVPFPVFDHLTSTLAPPNNASYRYVKLTAGDTYNTGLLTSEVVSGSSPLVLATAIISLAGSPLNGKAISLINTERRALRAGSSGVSQSDQLQGFGLTGTGTGGGTTRAFDSWGASGSAPFIYISPVSDGANGTPRTGDETRGKNIGVTYYMRVL